MEKQMQKHLLFLILTLMLALPYAQAQTANGVRAFSTASGKAENVSFVVGQTFFQQTTGSSGLEVAEGVCQAQIMYDTITLDGCQNAGVVSPDTLLEKYDFFKGYDGTITFNGEELHILPAGHYDSTDYDSRHYSWVSQFNYDSVTAMVLDVWPIYEVYDTLRLDLSAMDDFHEGDNDRFLNTIHDCDSLVHYFVLTCGDTIRDYDGNIYTSVFVGPYCWTKQNLQAEHYSFPGYDTVYNMIYHSPEYPNVAENLQQYGRLYSWYAAVGLPEGSSASPITDGYGMVQGVCPEGWHIPTEINMLSLADLGTTALKSENLWLIPGTNTVGYTAYPAGIYNPNTGRFENILGETRYWTSESVGSTVARNCVISLGCEELLMDTKTKSYGFSVRCVKTQEGNL